MRNLASLPDSNATPPSATQPVQLCLLSADSRGQLIAQLQQFAASLEARWPFDPRTSATELTERVAEMSCRDHASNRIALLAKTPEDLVARTTRAIERLKDSSCQSIRDVQGIYFTEQPLYAPGRLAFLFPGEGAHYAGMLADLRTRFPEADEVLEACELIESDVGSPVGLMRACFSDPSTLADDQRVALESQMERFSFSVLTVLVASWQLLRVLEELQLLPDMMVGHSSGETSALYASGTVSQRDPRRRGAIFASMMALDAELRADVCDTALLAIGADRRRVQALLDGHPFQSGRADLAMDNCPHQIVVVGDSAAIDQFEPVLQSEGLIYQRLPVDGPVHTPQFRPYISSLENTWSLKDICEPLSRLYSCATARPFPSDPHEVYNLANAQWELPVDFTGVIQQMYSDGGRIFVEVGPRGNLSAFTEDILRGEQALVVPADVINRSSSDQCDHLAAQLFVHHVPLNLHYLYRGQGLENTERTVNAYNRTEVMLRHQEVMKQFLQVQQDVMEAYVRSQSGRPAQVAGCMVGSISSAGQPFEEKAALAHDWPLVGKIVHHAPGHQMVMQRALDIEEDLYADEHTVGGQSVSAVNPAQHGLPIMPMTFFLEMMSQTAATMFPGYVVTSISRIKLRRWLAFYAGAPGTSEVKLKRMEPVGGGDVVRLQAMVVDMGDSVAAVQDGGGTAATAELTLEPDYQLTSPSDFEISNPAPCTVTLQYLYDNLFHGPLLQGVRSLDEYGDLQVRGEIEVLPRDRIFASRPNPEYMFDPVTLDVAMHPLAGWHLEQPDQTGRIMLPYELAEIEFFTSAPDVGERMICHGHIGPHGARHFTHSLEVLREDGRLWCRLTNIKCWRFYLPFNEVNFHGPKNIYYLSSNWLQNVPRPTCDQPAIAHLFSEAFVSLMRMEPPDDLQQPAIQIAASRVMMSPKEQQYLEQNVQEPSAKAAVIFERGVCKDAVRKLWEHRTGEKLFASDVETIIDETSHLAARPRDEHECRQFPSITFCAANGALVAAAFHGPSIGLDVVSLAGDNPDPSRIASNLRAAQRANGRGSTDGSVPRQLSDEISQLTCEDGTDIYVWTIVQDDHLISIAVAGRPFGD